jgi:multisubunit Na+/H+ antiporter MnhC subunit
VYIIAMVLITTGIAVLIMKDNLIKKIIGLSVFGNGIHLLLISIGYRLGGIEPILQNTDITAFVQTAVDPLPQALVLTSIVINLSVVALALVIAIEIYREFRTLNMKKVRSLKE